MDVSTGMYFFPIFFVLLFSIVPLLVAVWFIMKIQSIDTTLKEISIKLDRLHHKSSEQR